MKLKFNSALEVTFKSQLGYPVKKYQMKKRAAQELDNTWIRPAELFEILHPLET